MWKRVLVAFGLVELAFPRRVVEFGEALAFSNPGESELRPWTIPAARVEGIAFLALVLRGKPSYSRLEPLLGLLGVPALLAPRRYLDAAMRIAYEDAERIEPKPWVVPFTRLLGLVYVLVALRGVFSDRVGSR